ncbi:hypothetical protein DPMN_093333 [Dreissena polymorpha]|uniref:Uncharacterized protein n=1 Tax=Dreissena polymorpha TaxID=45954 RepID=A0A9D4R1M4_DREPO|nr:hypothetical protein DPMN_093333 [Dreissena polymorpha]
MPVPLRNKKGVHFVLELRLVRCANRESFRMLREFTDENEIRAHAGRNPMNKNSIVRTNRASSDTNWVIIMRLQRCPVHMPR